MKKVLILAYDFPPYVSVGGLRPFSWFKYMHEFGVYPIIITRQWNNKFGNHLDYIAGSDFSETIIEESDKGKILRTPYFPNLSNRLMLKYGNSKFKLLRKGITAFYEYSQYMFPIGPKSNLYLAAKDYLAKTKVDIIIATGEPFVLLDYASKLSSKFNIPWIADYRDPWTEGKTRRKKGVPVGWDAFLERKILKNVSAITTVSEFLKKKLSSLVSSEPIYIIPNGYDPEALSDNKKIEQSNRKFSIALGGTIYKWHPVESFLRVSNNFVEDFLKEIKFEINFYGINIEKEIVELINTKYQSLRQVVNIYPKMSNEQYLKEIAGNNILLLFNDYHILGTKIYDNLALKRQIMLCYDDDPEAKELRRKYYKMEESDSDNKHVQKELINKTNSGVIVKDAEHLKTVLRDFYVEFEQKGFIHCDSVNTEQYSRKIQVRNLVEVINKTLAGRKTM